MWFPKKYHYNLNKFTTMNVDLFISGISDTRKMSFCPKSSTSSCGTAYRLS